jgi:ABC-type proline/glycine betaine transport system permease subunit
MYGLARQLRIQVARQKDFTILEWSILLGLTACAVTVSELIGLTHKWEDALVYTVVVFAVVLTVLRPVWGREGFWRSFALILTGHTVAVLMAIQVLPPWRFGIPKLLLVPVGGIEGILIAVILRRIVASRSRKPRSW